MKAPKQTRPTLRTISQISGLAVATVSRALNDAPDIGAKTKARVREIANDIGYVPDRAGVRLRTGKTNVISLVLGADNEVTDHTGQLVSSIADALRQTRYHMIITPYDTTKDPMIPVRYIVETASADAVILNRTQPKDPRIAYLMENRFPFITHGRTSWCSEHPYFDFDNNMFGHFAIDAMVAANRSTIAMLAPPLQQSYAQHMIEGARAAAAQAGLSFEVLTGFDADEPGKVLRKGLFELLSDRPEIDGLICPSVTATIAAVVGLERAGRQVGRDIDVFAKEALPFLKFFRPGIKSVYEDVREAGTYLAKGAIQAIEDPLAKPIQRLITAHSLPETE